MPNVMADAKHHMVDIVTSQMNDGELVSLVGSCFDHSLPDTLQWLDDGTAYVATGDIPAMWLRDSSCQVRHLLPLVGEVPGVDDLIVGVLRRQMRCIELDSYANAFNGTPNNAGHNEDLPHSSPWVWERKYEVDSLAHPFHLGYLLSCLTGRVDWFDDHAAAAARAMVATVRAEQDHDACSTYRFTRPDPPVASDTLIRHGLGPQTAHTGLTWSGFRPSDDATQYGFNIPGNAFAAVVLGEMADTLDALGIEDDTVRSARRISAQIMAALATYGKFTDPNVGDAWWYEVDGKTGALFMDDANVPSLLALPMLGVCAVDDPVYLATRSLILSPENPYYFAGKHGAGVGSPHTPSGHIWPIALCVQGLTATSVNEQASILQQLVRSAAGTGVMHESFSVDDPLVFTREWFAWANAMFCELVLAMCGRPILVPPLSKACHA